LASYGQALFFLNKPLFPYFLIMACEIM